MRWCPGVRLPALVPRWVVASQNGWWAVVCRIEVGRWLPLPVMASTAADAVADAGATAMSVRSVSVLRWSWVTGSVVVLPVAGSVAVTLSPTLMSLIGLVVRSAIRTGVAGSKLSQLALARPMAPPIAPVMAPVIAAEAKPDAVQLLLVRQP